MSDAPQQPQLPPDLPLSVTLPIVQWRTLLNLLAEGHHQLRVLGPIYGGIERQLDAQVGQFVVRQRGNGVASEERSNIPP